MQTHKHTHVLCVPQMVVQCYKDLEKQGWEMCGVVPAAVQTEAVTTMENGKLVVKAPPQNVPGYCVFFKMACEASEETPEDTEEASPQRNGSRSPLWTGS